MVKKITVLLMLFSIFLVAQDDKVIIHGFGGWTYGKTDGNFLRGVGGEDGAWDNYYFALNINAVPTEKVRINVQFYADSSLDDKDVSLDYAFVEYSINDNLAIRAGRVKQPLGIYGETLKVGTIRPFYTLPQSIYGNANIVASGYNGVGLVGNFESDGGWGLDYHFYVGQIRTPFESVDFDSIALIAILGMENPDRFENSVFLEDLIIDDALGGYVNIRTPMEGFSFGASGYTGEGYSEITNIYPLEQLTYISGHAEYATDLITLRGEYGYRTQDSQDVTVYYLEGAYMLTEELQVAARFDKSDIEIPANLILDNFPTLADHQETVFGMSYWVSPFFVIKGSFHIVEGNFFAFPEWDTFIETIAEEGFNPDTNVFMLGAQFSF